MLSQQMKLSLLVGIVLNSIFEIGLFAYEISLTATTQSNVISGIILSTNPFGSYFLMIEKTPPMMEGILGDIIVVSLSLLWITLGGGLLTQTKIIAKMVGFFLLGSYFLTTVSIFAICSWNRLVG